jgi:hypothetical protein
VSTATVKYTANRVTQLVKTWSDYAGEEITAHHDTIGLVVGVDAIIVYGSELGMYRLHYRLGCVGLVARADDGRWYYRSRKC